ncbi:MAG: DUF4167 domain-containing protein [Azospirillaceae bacterium]|nr:DUF4167 domain-containing protein [Azospirillaceae bacterium]
MAFDNTGPRGPGSENRSKFPRRGPRPPKPAGSADGAHHRARGGGSAEQKQNQWLARAVDAERADDPIEAELCRQYAEHWFRVSRGQE